MFGSAAQNIAWIVDDAIRSQRPKKRPMSGEHYATSVAQKPKLSSSMTETTTEKNRSNSEPAMTSGAHARWPRAHKTKKFSVEKRPLTKFQKKVHKALDVVKGVDVIFDHDDAIAYTGTQLAGPAVAGRQGVLEIELFGRPDIIRMSNRVSIPVATLFEAIQFLGQEGELALVNTNTVPLHVDEYWVTPRVPTDLSPLTCWNTLDTTQPPIAASTNSPVLPWVIGVRPNDSNIFARQWKLVRRQSFVMTAGECRTQPTHTKGNIFTQATISRITGISGVGVVTSAAEYNYIPGVTMFRLFAFRLAYTKALGSALVTTGAGQLCAAHNKRLSVRVKEFAVSGEPYRLMGYRQVANTTNPVYITGTEGDVAAEATAAVKTYINSLIA